MKATGQTAEIMSPQDHAQGEPMFVHFFDGEVIVCRDCACVMPEDYGRGSTIPAANLIAGRGCDDCGVVLFDDDRADDCPHRDLVEG